MFEIKYVPGHATGNFHKPWGHETGEVGGWRAAKEGAMGEAEGSGESVPEWLTIGGDTSSCRQGLAPFRWSWTAVCRFLLTTDFRSREEPSQATDAFSLLNVVRLYTNLEK